MTRRNVSLQKENNCKFQLRFVKCCTLVVTEEYHILLSPLNRLVKCHLNILLCSGCFSISVRFTAKIDFCLNTGKRFFVEVSF